MKKFFTIGIFAMLFLFQRCAVNPVTGKKEFMLLSKDQEIEMGKQSDPEIIATYGLYKNDAMQAFIDKKGQAMAAISHRPELTYKFRILDSPIVNAFAVPGGYVYFTRGIMAHFNNEAEFAGVLGHEIGHIAARHSAKQYSRAMAAQLGLALGSIVSEEFAQFSDLAQTGTSLLFLKFGRDAERQSDELGVEYSTKTGYDAHEMADFFTTLKNMQASSGQQIPVFLSTHPDPGERQETVDKLADKWQRKTDRANYIENRDSYLDMIDGIVYGTDPKQGYVDNHTFFHPEMKFLFGIPSQWQLQNTPQQVSLAPEAGDGMMVFSMAQASSAEEASNQFREKYGLEILSSDNITIHNFRAKHVVARQPNEEQPLALSIYFIEDGNSIFYFLGATYADRYAQYKDIFHETATSYARLTDPARINVQPKRIFVKKVNGATTLRQALAQFDVRSNDLAEHALINGMALDDRLSAGTKIKVIR